MKILYVHWKHDPNRHNLTTSHRSFRSTENIYHATTEVQLPTSKKGIMEKNRVYQQGIMKDGLTKGVGLVRSNVQEITLYM